MFGHAAILHIIFNWNTWNLLKKNNNGIFIQGSNLTVAFGGAPFYSAPHDFPIHMHKLLTIQLWISNRITEENTLLPQQCD